MKFENIRDEIMLEIKKNQKLNSDFYLKKVDKLAEFILNLSKWNKRANLVGKADPLDIFRYLVIDSLFLVEFLAKIGPQFRINSILDIGAGAGIPGIPFRIFYQKGTYLMVEPRKKRSVFINLMIKKLNLKGTSVFPKSIEEFSGTKFSLCLSRGFCHWEKFLKIAYNYLLEQGFVIVFSNAPWKKVNLVRYEYIMEYQYQLKPKVYRYFWLFSKKAPS